MIGSEELPYVIIRTSSKSARLVVDPSGTVEARVPTGRSDQSIEQLVRSKARWIIRQQDYFASFRPRDPQRQYVSGESIRYLGRQYRLKVMQSEHESAKLLGKHLVVETDTSTNCSNVRRIVLEWYRVHAANVFRLKADHLLETMAAHGICEAQLTVRWMTRRWGSCTPSKRIILNPLLVINPIDCVEYVVAHELCHLKVPNHGDAFYRLLSTVMPDWQNRRERLRRSGTHLSF
tara:strand:- start:9331 stop:10032 length:702 start_codon:yes stop_codon:yes gene_type:complete